MIDQVASIITKLNFLYQGIKYNTDLMLVN